MFKVSIHLNFRFFKSSKRNKKESDKSPMFIIQAMQLTSSLTNVRTRSTIDNYQTALRSFSHYAGTAVTMNHINSHLIEGFQQWLIKQNVSQNTISCYMRSLRSIIYQLQPAAKSQHVFDNVYTGKMCTDKRSISPEDIVRLRQLILPPNSSLAFSRDIFLFCFYALGMPFVDVAFLQKKQINGDYIVYYRHKTGKRIKVKVEPPMWKIIHRYMCEDSNYVFPILTDTDDIKCYEAARSKYNRHLRKIGKLTGIECPLTSYVARHSWASIAYHSNIDLSVISKALGHTSPNTTLIYIREIDDNRIDRANRDLLARLM